jgi:hypothetical protein
MSVNPRKQQIFLTMGSLLILSFAVLLAEPFFLNYNAYQENSVANFCIG